MYPVDFSREKPLQQQIRETTEWSFPIQADKESRNTCTYICIQRWTDQHTNLNFIEKDELRIAREMSFHPDEEITGTYMYMHLSQTGHDKGIQVCVSLK